MWSVRYNHFHDQLILSSSSDSRVILLSIPSLSSEPYGHLDDDEDLDDELRYLLYIECHVKIPNVLGQPCFD